jgi:hypothetical protein
MAVVKIPRLLTYATGTHFHRFFVHASKLQPQSVEKKLVKNFKV